MLKRNTADIVLCMVLSALVSIGVFGNLISIYIWTRGKRCRKSNFGAFFVVLSILDTLLLLVPGINLILILSPLQFNFESQFDIPCKILGFGFQLLAQVSMWLIVCLTVARTVFIFKPWLQIDRGKIYILAISLLTVFACINMPHLLFDKVVYDTRPNNKGNSEYIPFDDNVQMSRNGSVIIHGKCKMSSTNFNTLTYHIIVQAGLFVVIPFMTNFVCNCLMILQLFRRMVNARVLGDSLVIRAYRDVRVFTKRVVIISITHCVFTIPQVAFDIHMETVDHKDAQFSHRINYPLLHKTVTTLFYVNSFLNLILYYTTGRDFKLDMNNLVKCERK